MCKNGSFMQSSQCRLLFTPVHVVLRKIKSFNISKQDKLHTFNRLLHGSAQFTNFAFAEPYEHCLELACNKYAFADLQCITKNANHPFHFPDIRLRISLVCLQNLCTFYQGANNDIQAHQVTKPCMQ